MQNQYYPFVNLPLRYPYYAMEPFIDTKTMELHHSRHLQTYVDNLNRLLMKNGAMQKLSLTELIVLTANSRDKYRTDIHNNAGGVFNHRFYFDGLENPSSFPAKGLLAGALEQSFGSINNMQNELKEAALSVFGSGYAWLVCGRRSVGVITTANQDTPLERGMYPLLNIDVWEHAYYLKHYNRRADYVADFLGVINWNEVQKRYLSFIKR